jgi:sugar O-acyltransferase (sialic acid O-acetyltransferase NeuD family)
MEPMATSLLIFPCNGNGSEAVDCLDDSWAFTAFVDDDPDKHGCSCYGYPVLARAAFAAYPDARVLAVPGNPDNYRSRRAVIADLDIDPARFATIIDPSARVSSRARIGRNVLLMANVVVSGNAVIGDHVCVLPNTVIHHDVTVGPWSLIGSNVTIAGYTIVEENCYIGSGSSVMNGRRVGARALVGMASNVIRDVPPDSVIVGNPGSVLRRKAPRRIA